MVFVLWALPNHPPIKYRRPIKKNNRITPTYVIEIFFDVISLISIVWSVLKASLAILFKLFNEGSIFTLKSRSPCVRSLIFGNNMIS